MKKAIIIVPIIIVILIVAIIGVIFFNLTKEKAYLAISSDYSYQLEFYELLDDAYATAFYNNNKTIFENAKGKVTSETNVNLKNSSKYTLSSNGLYMVVSRINNTVIYLKVNDTYRDTVKDVLKELGY